MARQSERGGTTTGYAIFDSSGLLLDTVSPTPGGRRSATLSSKQTQEEVLSAIISGLKSFDGVPVRQDPDFLAHAVARWKNAQGEPVEAETSDGRWKLLTMHPRPDGGSAFVSVDITQMKRDQSAFKESAEIFRCITDSHPLPVWVIDAETHEIYYESIDASRLLGRPWNPHERQYITSEQIDPRELAEISALVGEKGILRDHEVRVKQADGSVVWCAANFRGGTYRGRPAIIVGVVDITERKKRENLLAFLIEHHPLPVWMNDARTGEIIYQSHAAQKLFGWERGPDGKVPRLRDYFVDDEQYLELSRDLFA